MLSFFFFLISKLYMLLMISNPHVFGSILIIDHEFSHFKSTIGNINHTI